MKKIVFLLLSFFILSCTSYAQVLTAPGAPKLDSEIYEQHHAEEREPIPAQHIREADVMWSRTVWRKLDMREKINHSYYFPEYPIGPRMSLIDLLLKGVEKEGLRAYEPSDPNNEFKELIDYAGVKVRFGAVNDTMEIYNPDKDMMEKKIIKGEVRSKQVKEYIFKELWFFDRNRSVLDVRIIAICPIRFYYKPEDIDEENMIRRKVCWFYFPDIRKSLAKQAVFNSQGNDGERRTYDDLLYNRFFSSYIIREANVYNDRNVDEYTVGIESLLEADKMKNKTFNFEQDLWEF